NYYKKYVEHSAKSDDTVDELVMQKREESRFVCLVGLALVYMHELVKKPQDVITLFSEDELKRYSTDPDKVARAHTLVMEAHVAGNRLAEAERALEIVITGAPGNRRTPGAARKLAIALDSVAKDLKDKNKDEYAATRSKMAKYFLIWLKNAPAAGEVIKAEHAFAVATKLLEIWKETGDVSYGQEAAPILEKTLAGGYSGKLPGKVDEIRWRFAQVLVGLEDWEKARNTYEELVKTKSDNALIFLELGEVYLTLSRRTQGEDQKKYWQSGMDLFNRVLGSLRGEGKFSETWWRTMFNYVTIMFESGEYKPAYEGIKGIQVEKKDFDNDQWGYKTKLIELLKKIEAKLPK
ncbi:MAG: hypothetical protein RDV41_07795, partial [Planctomycetota bacterium]|nr:hypothetical protein [Planctomycetota bacterium]